MSVVVDTCVWSEVFRKKSSHPAKAALLKLIQQDDAVMLGAVRQELLCGFPERSSFLRLRDLMHEFKDATVQTEDHERAAEMSNICRAAGVQGSQADFLICAVAERLGIAIFTTDKDFLHFARHIPIRLFEPENA